MAEWNHPRRATKETISYLSQVEPVIDALDIDDHSYGPDGHYHDGDDAQDDVGREQLLDNVLEELKHQTASIMEDRQGSVIAEKVARRLNPTQLRVMLGRCRGYMLSLANNRYSSHVLQTLLSIVGPVVEAEVSSSGTDGNSESFEDDASALEKEQGAGSLQEVVLALVSELTGAWAELLDDISGSHTGRAFLQLLGGLPILTEKRGKQSRHSHSIGTAVGPEYTPSAPERARGGKKAAQRSEVDREAVERWSTLYRHQVPVAFEKALAEVTFELMAVSTRDLQVLVCGTFGCPLLVMLLRVYANIAVDPSSGRLPCVPQGSGALDLVRKVLEWQDEEQSTQVVYAMSGEKTASHFLEAIIWLTPSAFFDELYRRCFETKLLEFCEHGVSNFLIQAALQRADKAIAEGMVRSVGENASALLRARRAGVLWRAAQACVRLGLAANTQAQLVEHIAFAVLAEDTATVMPHADDGANGPPDGHHESEKRSKVASDAFQAAREWVPALLSPRLPAANGSERLFLNVPGARIVQNVLAFAPSVAAPVLKAVVALPEAVLAAVARDNVGSRCLLDPVLDAAGSHVHGKDKNKPAQDARRSLMRAFRGHMVAMACDRVAWHVLLKCFRGADMKDKKAIVEELASGGESTRSRLSAYPSGRSVLTECMVERFSRSPREWEDAFKNRDNRAKMLDDIFAVESHAKRGKTKEGIAKEDRGEDMRKEKSSARAPSPFSTSSQANVADGVLQEAGGEGKIKEKRRRQRGRGRRGKSSAGGGADSERNGTEDDVSAVSREVSLQENDVPGPSAGSPERRGSNETTDKADERKRGGSSTPKKSSKRKLQDVSDSVNGGSDAEGVSFVIDTTRKPVPFEVEASPTVKKTSKKTKNKVQHAAETDSDARASDKHPKASKRPGPSAKDEQRIDGSAGWKEGKSAKHHRRVKTDGGALHGSVSSAAHPASDKKRKKAREEGFRLF